MPLGRQKVGFWVGQAAEEPSQVTFLRQSLPGLQVVPDGLILQSDEQQPSSEEHSESGLNLQAAWGIVLR